MSRKRRTTTSAGPLVQAREACARGTGAFSEDCDVLETARVLLDLRARIEDEEDEQALAGIVALEHVLTRVLHGSISLSPRRLHVVGVLRKHRLTRIEREVMLLRALSATGMVRRVADVEDIQERLCRRGRDGLAVARALAPGAKLARSELVILEPRDQHVLTRVTPSPAFIGPLLATGRAAAAWRVRTYDELLDRCYSIFHALTERADALEDAPWSEGGSGSARETAPAGQS